MRATPIEIEVKTPADWGIEPRFVSDLAPTGCEYRLHNFYPIDVSVVYDPTTGDGAYKITGGSNGGEFDDFLDELGLLVTVFSFLAAVAAFALLGAALGVGLLVFSILAGTGIFAAIAFLYVVTVIVTALVLFLTWLLTITAELRTPLRRRMYAYIHSKSALAGWVLLNRSGYRAIMET